ISLQKFQQKARKQTKQKKSKSSDFLMKVSIEVSENPAFNNNNTDISAHQTYKVGLIRYDKLTSSLAAHPQKLRLQAQAEPRGNECSRNYFDPLMDEEINPRQCGIESHHHGGVISGQADIDEIVNVNTPAHPHPPTHTHTHTHEKKVTECVWCFYLFALCYLFKSKNYS
uniref:Uncharacterized protein n=1 Tax=Laticauda laticaudata TaxID=8630 RepID=A0A8C5RTN5_LATLA